VDTGICGFEESTLDTTRGAYSPEFRRQVVELVHAGRTPEELVYEFGPTAQSIRNWVAQWERNAGRGDGGLTREERGQLNRLRRENRQLRLAREILLNACPGRDPGAAARFARETNILAR
jgi:transposase